MSRRIVYFAWVYRDGVWFGFIMSAHHRFPQRHVPTTKYRLNQPWINPLCLSTNSYSCHHNFTHNNHQPTAPHRLAGNYAAHPGTHHPRHCHFYLYNPRAAEQPAAACSAAPSPACRPPHHAHTPLSQRAPLAAGAAPAPPC